MDRRHFLKGLAGLALSPLFAPQAFASDAHWSYEGPHGPHRWGRGDERSVACAPGTQQSPIDIGETIRARLPLLKVKWSRRADTLANTGHTVELNFRDGSTLEVGRQRYSLLNLHFHHPSEHLIGGRRFPMEAQFVHRNDPGFLAIVSVMLTPGKGNRTFSRIVSAAPKQAGPAIKADASIDANGLMPAQRGY